MTSELTDEFLACYRLLPARIRQQARRNYRLWKTNPHQPSLEFKLVGKRMPIFSVRIGIGWRVLGVRNGDNMVWFWIGSHATYDRLLQSMGPESRILNPECMASALLRNNQ